MVAFNFLIVLPISSLNNTLCVCICTYSMLSLLFAFYLSSKINGEDGGGLGGPVGAVMVVMMCPLFLLPSEQILVSQRNTSVVLTRERCRIKQETYGREEKTD